MKKGLTHYFYTFFLRCQCSSIWPHRKMLRPHRFTLAALDSPGTAPPVGLTNSLLIYWSNRRRIEKNRGLGEMGGVLPPLRSFDRRSFSPSLSPLRPPWLTFAGTTRPWRLGRMCACFVRASSVPRTHATTRRRRDAVRRSSCSEWLAQEFTARRAAWPLSCTCASSMTVVWDPHEFRCA